MPAIFSGLIISCDERSFILSDSEFNEDLVYTNFFSWDCLLVEKIKSNNINSVRKFVNSLKLFGYGYSWGGFESVALHQEFRETGKRKYMNLAKDEHLVRLHIGLEDPNDLIADIKQALRHLK